MNTTPPIIRSSITSWDIQRISMMNESRSKAYRNKEAMDQAKARAHTSLNK